MTGRNAPIHCQQGDPTIPTSEQKKDSICESLVDSKAQDIVVLNVRGLTLLADYFIICTGTSAPHISAISRHTRERLREEFRLCSKPEGEKDSVWIVMDYGDVVLHVFREDRRQFYDLERLWSDAKKSIWTAGEGEAAPPGTE
ncbi:MAG: ribosome silencing factor [Armatimonadetes bacterium]|nr:ribosome silencing factor [Armatimonadota bacterium]